MIRFRPGGDVAYGSWLSDEAMDMEPVASAADTMRAPRGATPNGLDVPYPGLLAPVPFRAARGQPCAPGPAWVQTSLTPTMRTPRTSNPPPISRGFR